MKANDVVRLKILNDMLQEMSEEDRRTYVIMSFQNDNARIMQELAGQGEKLDELVKRTSWTKSFLSDVGANVITNAAFLLVSKLFK